MPHVCLLPGPSHPCWYLQPGILVTTYRLWHNIKALHLLLSLFKLPFHLSFYCQYWRGSSKTWKSQGWMLVRGGVRRACKWQRSRVKTLHRGAQKSELVNEMTGIFSWVRKVRRLGKNSSPSSWEVSWSLIVNIAANPMNWIPSPASFFFSKPKISFFPNKLFSLFRRMRLNPAVCQTSK